jgi:hypothetical protein
MELQSLRFVATEADLNDLAANLLPPNDKVRHIQITVVPEGIRVTGTYQTVIGIPVETLWEVFIAEGKIAARLKKLKVGVLSLGLAKGYVLDAIAAAVGSVELRGESLFFDIDAFLREKGLPLHTNLRSARCDCGRLIIEGG